MGFRNVFGVAAGLVATSVGLSASSFAAAGDFNFTATLSQGTAGLTTITSGQINSTNSSNFFTYTDGTDSGQIDNAAGFAGTSIVLENYGTTATAPVSQTGNVSDGFVDSIALTDLTTGQTITKSLVGTYLGTVNANAASLGQTYSVGTLTFLFTDGTYTVTNTGIVSPGAPGGKAGASGANVSFTTAGAAPEPSALMLIVPGVIGMVGFARRRKSSK